MRSTLDVLARLVLAPHEQARLGLGQAKLILRRAWPRSRDHLLLEYEAENGRLVPGQWFADAERCSSAACDTLQATMAASGSGEWTAHRSPPSCVVHPLAAELGYVLLQVGGADRALHGLAPLLARPDAQVLVHQPERRAVVRLGTGGDVRFAKVVPPKRVAAVVAAGRTATNLAATAFVTPKPLLIDHVAGVVEWSALPGTALYDMLGEQRMFGAAGMAGAALNALHQAQPTSAKQHTAADEVAMLQTWIARAASFAPELREQLAAVTPGVFAALLADASPPVVLHRDFYDKQVFVDDYDSVGLLDFDTLACGEAALDVANALVHFELRAVQGRSTAEQAQTAKAALLDGYRPDRHTLRRLDAYMNAVRLRLVCVYTFRPRWRADVRRWLEHCDMPVDRYRAL